MILFEDIVVYLLERVHTKTLVHAGRVTEESCERSLEYDTKVECPISHSLMNDGITTCFADDQIGPLNNDDRHKERGVTGELKRLAVPECLFYR